jgi:hypothetical protein
VQGELGLNVRCSKTVSVTGAVEDVLEFETRLNPQCCDQCFEAVNSVGRSIQLSFRGDETCLQIGDLLFQLLADTRFGPNSLRSHAAGDPLSLSRHFVVHSFTKFHPCADSSRCPRYPSQPAFVTCSAPKTGEVLAACSQVVMRLRKLWTGVNRLFADYENRRLVVTCVVMARPKGVNPPRGPGVPVRLNEIERRYLDAAKDKRWRESLRSQGATTAKLADFFRSGAFALAEKVLGCSLEEFEAKELKERRRAEK